MRLPSECYQMKQVIETHMPHLSRSQLTGLVLWVCGTILAGSACQNAVASAHPPGEAGASWCALRFWIELGFKMLKSAGWQWQRTRRAGPERISRHWLVLSVTALIALAYGTRVEDAFDRKIAPGSLRAPPKCLASTHCNSRSRPGRTVGLVHHGIGWLRRLMHRGRLWSQVWLLPEPWPEPKPGLKINCHTPT